MCTLPGVSILQCICPGIRDEAMYAIIHSQCSNDFVHRSALDCVDLRQFVSPLHPNVAIYNFHAFEMYPGLCLPHSQCMQRQHSFIRNASGVLKVNVCKFL